VCLGSCGSSPSGEELFNKCKERPGTAIPLYILHSCTDREEKRKKLMVLLLAFAMLLSTVSIFAGGQTETVEDELVDDVTIALPVTERPGIRIYGTRSFPIQSSAMYSRRISIRPVISARNQDWHFPGKRMKMQASGTSNCENVLRFTMVILSPSKTGSSLSTSAIQTVGDGRQEGRFRESQASLHRGAAEFDSEDFG